MPIAFIYGDQDGIVSVHNCIALMSMADSAGVTCSIIRGAGHAPFEGECARAFVSAVIDTHASFSFSSSSSSSFGPGARLLADALETPVFLKAMAQFKTSYHPGQAISGNERQYRCLHDIATACNGGRGLRGRVVGWT